MSEKIKHKEMISISVDMNKDESIKIKNSIIKIAELSGAKNVLDGDNLFD